MSRQTVFAIVGAAGDAQYQHIPNMVRASNVHLKTICDPCEGVALAAQAKYGIPQMCTDYHRVLNDPEVEAVVIATDDDSYVPLTLGALAAGKHVYVGQPLVGTPEEWSRVVAAQEQAGRHVAIGFNRRLSPAYTLVRQILDTHGGAHNLYYRISDAYWMWGKSHTPRTRVVTEVCHIFDILRFLTGSEPASVYVVESRPDDEMFMLKFASGCVATIMSSGYAHIDLPKEYLEVITKRGAITVTDFAELRTFGLADCDPVTTFAGHIHPDCDHLHRYLLEKQGAQALLDIRRSNYDIFTCLETLRAEGSDTPERAELEHYWERHAPLTNYMVDKGWLQAINHFAQCIAEGATPRNANAYDALRVAQVIAAAIESRDSGKPVAL